MSSSLSLVCDDDGVAVLVLVLTLTLVLEQAGTTMGLLINLENKFEGPFIVDVDTDVYDVDVCT